MGSVNIHKRNNSVYIICNLLRLFCSLEAFLAEVLKMFDMTKKVLLSCIDYFLITALYLVLAFLTASFSWAIILLFLFWAGNICFQFWLGRNLFRSVKSSAICLLMIFLPAILLWTVCYFINPYWLDFLLYPAVCILYLFDLGAYALELFIVTALFQLPPLIALWCGHRNARRTVAGN